MYYQKLHLKSKTVQYQKEQYLTISYLIETLEDSQKRKNDFYLLQFDQEKAFDKIVRNFLLKTMEKMGISKTFINFIRILHSNGRSVIINNGLLSQSVSLSIEL